MLFIYNQFVSVNNNLSKSVTNRILARTKKLTLSSKKYNKYLESFNDTSQEKIYDLKTDYDLPVISPKRTKKNNRKTLTPNMKEKFKIQLNISNYNNKKNSSNKSVRNKKTNFFICDFDYLNKDEKKTNKNNINNKYCLTSGNFNSYKRKYKAFKSEGKNKNINIDKNVITLNNEEKSSTKQIFCLLDSIFMERKKVDFKDDDDLIYDEKEIFGYKNIYLDYLKDELKSLNNKEKKINMNSSISYNYNNKIYGEIILQLNSAKIEVFDKINDSICCTVDIPFNILCLFYLSTVKQLAYIILNIFKNDHFLKNEKITNEQVINILENIITKQISYKNDTLIFKNNFEDEDKRNILTDYMNYRNLKYRSNVRYNFLSLNKKEEALKKIIFDNCTFNNYRDSIFNSNFNHNVYNENIEIIKNLFDSNINIINLSWITLDKNYLIKITMPRVIIKLSNYNKQINHFINKEIFVFLFKNNFKNWNFYISHYLFTLKKFRICINKILSYNTMFNYLKNRNRKMINNLKLNQTTYSGSNKINVNKINIINNSNYEKYNISNLKYEQYENSLNDNEYIFFVSDDEYIHLYKMKSYVLYSYSCSELKHPKIYYFDFSFYQMKILFYKSKYENLGQFLQRLLKINKEKKKLYLDYYYFHSFKTMNNEQIDHHFKESYLIENLNNLNDININKNVSNLNVNANNENIKNMIEKELILKVSNPKFVSVSIKKNKDINNLDIEENWVKKEGEIGRALIEKLVETDIKNWGTILWQNKDKIEALKNSRIIGGRRSNIFKGKKDFRAVFKKFLKIK